MSSAPFLTLRREEQTNPVSLVYLHCVLFQSSVTFQRLRNKYHIMGITPHCQLTRYQLALSFKYILNIVTPFEFTLFEQSLMRHIIVQIMCIR